MKNITKWLIEKYNLPLTTHFAGVDPDPLGEGDADFRYVDCERNPVGTLSFIGDSVYFQLPMSVDVDDVTAEFHELPDLEPENLGAISAIDITRETEFSTRGCWFIADFLNKYTDEHPQLCEALAQLEPDTVVVCNGGM